MKAMLPLIVIAAVIAGWFAVGPGAGPPTGGCAAPKAIPESAEPAPDDVGTISWTDVSSLGARPPGDDQILDVAIFGDRYVAAGRSTNGPKLNAFIVSSVDGDSWSGSASDRRFPNTEFGRLMVAGDRLFALGSTSTNDRGGSRAAVWFTDDGLNWTESSGPLDERWVSAVGAGDDGLLLLGGDSSGQRPVAWSSTDGRTWAEVPLKLPVSMEHASFADMTWIGGEWLGVGSMSRGADAASAAVVWRSRDGRSWSCEVLPDSGGVRTRAWSLHRAGDRYLVVGDASLGCGWGASCPGFQATWEGSAAGWTSAYIPGMALDGVGDAPMLSNAVYSAVGDDFIGVAEGVWLSPHATRWGGLVERGERRPFGVTAVAAAGDRVLIGGTSWLAVGTIDR